MPEWLKGADCKSAVARLRWFESTPAHHKRDDDICYRLFYFVIIRRWEPTKWSFVWFERILASAPCEPCEPSTSWWAKPRFCELPIIQDNPPLPTILKRLRKRGLFLCRGISRHRGGSSLLLFMTFSHKKWSPYPCPPLAVARAIFLKPHRLLQ